jgi:uncharacterized protein YdhG (YjbR/CyaY superfamily)
VSTLTARLLTADPYLASLQEPARTLAQGVCSTLRGAMPNATEKMRYGMPALILQGRNVIHMAGWKHHVGLYPLPRFDEAFERALVPYRTARDTVRFLYADPVPHALIDRIARAIVDRYAIPS